MPILRALRRLSRRRPDILVTGPAARPRPAPGAADNPRPGGAGPRPGAGRCLRPAASTLGVLIGTSATGSAATSTSWPRVPAAADPHPAAQPPAAGPNPARLTTTPAGYLSRHPEACMTPVHGPNASQRAHPSPWGDQGRRVGCGPTVAGRAESGPTTRA